MFNYKGIPCAYPYCCGLDQVKPGYPNKLALKLTVSLLLLWLWSLHDHLPVFIWLWLSLSLLLKSLKEHSLQSSTYSRFIRGIKRRLIYGSSCFFNFSTLFDMKHWFAFKYWLLYLLSYFINHLLEGVWWQDFSLVMWKKAELAWRPSHCCFFSLHHVPWIYQSGMQLDSIFWLNNCVIPFLEN